MGFQENLVRARKARGLSQEELAAAIGVSRQAVSKWETGDAMPDLPKLVALADALEMSLDALCGRRLAQAPVREALPPRQKRCYRVFMAVGCFLSVCLLLGAVWQWSQRDVVPAEEAPAAYTLPEEFSVSGATFSPSGTEERRTLGYCFTPSVSSEAWRYQITFTTSSGVAKTFDIDCKGGVCTGEVFLAQYESYTATASIVDDAGNRRNAVLATGLSFSDSQAIWQPAEA